MATWISRVQTQQPHEPTHCASHCARANTIGAGFKGSRLGCNLPCSGAPSDSPKALLGLLGAIAFARCFGVWGEATDTRGSQKHMKLGSECFLGDLGLKWLVVFCWAPDLW